ncbi:VanZ family protein [Microbacterium limosum]|uniref:VanZ family protein n=1 Tax=Microbacterium limosum TaxID=3079935 RepID=A0AAU0MGG9_9MICO|nr:VanZ family protein [Microbacterium sp. Y20]WOQ69266.1 VanZ family protein [Microbacterium sp. Y20]
MHTSYEQRRRPASQVSRGLAVGTLVIYVATLGLIALWPTHVDAPFSPHIAWLLERVPLLTYNRLEFAANILLFVPLGFLLAVLVAPRWRWTIPLAALAVSALIEGWQALGPGRTSTLLDVAANAAGGVLGLVIALIALPRRR